MENSYIINNASEITLGKSLRVIGKVAGATGAMVLGGAAGVTQALAMAALSAPEGSYTHMCLTHSNKTLYRKARQDSLSYVSDSIAGRDARTRVDTSSLND